MADDVNILVVDDEAELQELMKNILVPEGYNLIPALKGETALQIITERPLSLILLDIMLPDIDGYTVCQRIRKTSQVPIMMITAKNNEEEKIAFFEAGADDFVTKPFSPRELIARVKAVLRRSSAQEIRPMHGTFRYYKLKIDFDSRIVTVGKEIIDLSVTEYKILVYLAINAFRTVTPQEILGEVWGDEHRDENHTLQVNISRIRQKIHDYDQECKYIETKAGQGYLMRGRFQN